MNLSNTISLIGSGGFLAQVLSSTGSLEIGMLLGTRDPAIRRVMGPGPANRNLAAAIVVTVTNFPAP